MNLFNYIGEGDGFDEHTIKAAVAIRDILDSLDGPQRNRVTNDLFDYCTEPQTPLIRRTRARRRFNRPRRTPKESMNLVREYVTNLKDGQNFVCSEVESACNMATSTAHRALGTLEREGLLWKKAAPAGSGLRVVYIKRKVTS